MVEGNFAPLQKEAVWWPARLRQAAAICNSLTFVRKNMVVGDPVDMKMCQAVEAHFVVGALLVHNGAFLSFFHFFLQMMYSSPGQPGVILGFS